MTFFRLILFFLFGTIYVNINAQPPKTTPKMLFGHDFGDNYWLANYSQMIRYWKQLEKESDRIKLQRIGTTSEGRPMWMAIISAPENLKRSSYYRDISEKLARAEISNAEAKRLSKIGKSVVWIDGGLHGNEIMPGQSIGRLVQQLVTNNDDETQRIRRDVITLICITNPDGMEIVSNYYMSEPDSLKRGHKYSSPTWHKYIGHDNNRDYYMSSQKETQAVNNILYREWFPRIVVNQHQRGGPVMMLKKSLALRGPFIHPLVVTTTQLITEAVLSRFIMEGKRGVRADWDEAWTNGFMSVTPGYHNMIGIVTETAGEPDPQANRLTYGVHFPKESDITPLSPFDIIKEWPFSVFLDYQISMNMSVLNIASIQREQLLYGAYTMAQNSIEKGNTDTWPLFSNQLLQLIDKPSFKRRTDLSNQILKDLLSQTPSSRYPRGYIIPADQADFPTAVQFVNTLIRNGIVIYRATSDFYNEGKSYPKGTFVIKTAQAFRPFLMEMFEPTDEEGSSYALAEQMGISFDRIRDEMSGPFEKVNGFADCAVPFKYSLGVTGYRWSGKCNNAFTVCQRLLNNGCKVSRTYEGDFYTKAVTESVNVLKKTATELGVKFSPVASFPDGLIPVKKPRIGIIETLSGGGDYTAGWYRFLFDQFEIPYSLIGPRALDSVDLNKQFDVILAITGMEIFTNDSVKKLTGQWLIGLPQNDQIKWGTARKKIAIPKIKKFVRQGGIFLAGGSSLENTVQSFELPLKMVKIRDMKLGNSSIQEIEVEHTSNLAKGFNDKLNLLCSFSDALFILDSNARNASVRPIGIISKVSPSTKGNKRIQERLKDAVPFADFPLGKGQIVLFGMNPNYRYQSHAAFKLIFNALYR